jgi:hypothetical protein
MEGFHMRSRLVVVLRLAAVVGSLVASEAVAGQYVLYLHGRSSQSWGRSLMAVSGWTNVTLSYDGNARLANASVSGLIRQTVRNYCSGDNSCVIACHSAGCLRTLYAVEQLRAEQVPLAVLWVEAAASAAGGTRLAEISTNLFGDQPIDEDIRRDSARSSTGWGYIQSTMPPSVMYHLAGRKDSCVWFVCGNWFLPAGSCDGLVCMDSAGGAARSGEFSDGCALAANNQLYPGRRYDSAQVACSGASKNHSELGDFVGTAVRTGIQSR